MYEKEDPDQFVELKKVWINYQGQFMLGGCFFKLLSQSTFYFMLFLIRCCPWSQEFTVHEGNAFFIKKMHLYLIDDCKKS
jgi:hypothetical protein